MYMYMYIYIYIYTYMDNGMGSLGGALSSHVRPSGQQLTHHT